MSYKYRSKAEQKEDIESLRVLAQLGGRFQEDYFNELLLTNRLGIRDFEKLFQAERAITSFKNMQLEKEFIPGSFNFDHLKDVHKFLFEDIYYFAGEKRAHNMEIDSVTKFCPAKLIEIKGQKIFEGLKEDNYFKDLSKNDFVPKLSRFMTELNILHPFREGNGRSKRAFVSALCKQAGYIINYGSVDKEKWIIADSAAFDNARDGQYDDTYLQTLLEKAVTCIEIQKIKTIEFNAVRKMRCYPFQDGNYEKNGNFLIKLPPEAPELTKKTLLVPITAVKTEKSADGLFIVAATKGFISQNEALKPIDNIMKHHIKL